MAQYFGDFLVEKGIVKQEQIVDALVLQVENQQPLAKMVWESKIWDAETLLRIFRYQHAHNVNFVRAVTENNLDNTGFQEVLKAHSSQRKPLGQILVEQNAIDLKTLALQLDEFLSQVYDAEPAPVPVSTSPGVFDELLKSMDDEFINGIKNSFGFLRSSNSSSTDRDMMFIFFHDLYLKIGELSGIAKLYGLDSISAIFSLMLETMGKVEALKPNFSADQATQVIDYYSSCLKILETLKNMYKSNEMKTESLAGLVEETKKVNSEVVGTIPV